MSKREIVAQRSQCSVRCVTLIAQAVTALLGVQLVGSPTFAVAGETKLSAQIDPIYEGLTRNGQHVCEGSKGLLYACGHLLESPYVFQLSATRRLLVGGCRVFPPGTDAQLREQESYVPPPPDRLSLLVRDAFFESGRDSMTVPEYVAFLAKVYRESGDFSNVAVKETGLLVTHVGTGDVEYVKVPWTVRRVDFTRQQDFTRSAATFIAQLCRGLQAGTTVIVGEDYMSTYPVGSGEAIRQEIAAGPKGPRQMPESPLDVPAFVRDLEAARHGGGSEEE